MSKQVNVTALPPCDVCHKPATYDARIPGQGWANLCEDHFKAYGCKLGTGNGQKLVVPMGPPIMKELLQRACEQVLSEVMKANCVTTGDTLPGQECELDELLGRLAEIYTEIVEQNQGGVPDGD